MYTDTQIKAAIAAIGDGAWTTINYTNAVFDEHSQRISSVEVAETPFSAFASAKKSEQVPGRLVVRRIPDFNAEAKRAAGQDSLFDVWRIHAFFTTARPDLLDTVACSGDRRTAR